MGVERTLYVMAAVRLDYKTLCSNDVFYENLLINYDDDSYKAGFSKDNLVLLDDGMNGKYAFFG